MHFDDFVELIRVSCVTRGERAGPIVIMQAAEKGLLHSVLAKVALPARFEDGDGCLQFRAASLFEGVGELQNSLLAEGRTINLQADGQAFGGPAAGDRNARNARE